MKKILAFLLFLVVLTFLSCSQNSKTENSANESIPKAENVKTELISITLLVSTTANELGSFNVSLEINPEFLEFIEFKPADNVNLDIKHKFFEEKNLIKIIGTSIHKTGIYGNQKIAYLYFRNIKGTPIKKFSSLEIKLFKESAYSPYPEMKELPAEFTVSISEGIISH
jgi:hypothetical protein